MDSERQGSRIQRVRSVLEGLDCQGLEEEMGVTRREGRRSSERGEGGDKSTEAGKWKSEVTTAHKSIF